MVDDGLSALVGGEAAEVGDALVGDDDLDGVFVVIDVGGHGDDGGDGAGSLAKERQRKMERKELRMKSPEPPMPLSMRVPQRWVELACP